MNVYFKKALNDFKCANTLMKSVDEEPDFLCTVAYLLQQAYEKTLKGFIFDKGVRVRKEHDISSLLDTTIELGYTPDKFLIKFADKLTYWEASTRYDLVNISTKDIAECLANFNRIFSELSNRERNRNDIVRYITSIVETNFSDIDVIDLLKYLPEKLPETEEDIIDTIYDYVSNHDKKSITSKLDTLIKKEK